MHLDGARAWRQFITADEGNISFMYLDTEQLVTVGIGNLIDPVSRALALPFQFKSPNRLRQPAGARASRSQIEAEWSYIKNHPNRVEMARRGASLCANETNLELGAAEVTRIFNQTTNAFESSIKGYFADYNRWPANAQLAVMAMGWGLGPDFPPNFPRFTAACNARDFALAAAEANISTWNLQRNDRSRRLLSNAAIVNALPTKYRLELVYFPGALPVGAANP
jgi:hypothetical protein